MPCRGVRGATTAAENTPEAILAATRELLAMLIYANQIEPDDVASVLFTTTPDLNAEFPAVAARQFGWHDTALLCGHEMTVPNALPRCVRILIHWNTEKPASAVQHIYINGAANLRPDRASLPPLDKAEFERWMARQMQEHRR